MSAQANSARQAYPTDSTSLEWFLRHDVLAGEAATEQVPSVDSIATELRQRADSASTCDALRRDAAAFCSTNGWELEATDGHAFAVGLMAETGTEATLEWVGTGNELFVALKWETQGVSLSIGVWLCPCGEDVAWRVEAQRWNRLITPTVHAFLAAVLPDSMMTVDGDAVAKTVFKAGDRRYLSLRVESKVGLEWNERAHRSTVVWLDPMHLFALSNIPIYLGPICVGIRPRQGQAVRPAMGPARVEGASGWNTRISFPKFMSDKLKLDAKGTATCREAALVWVDTGFVLPEWRDALCEYQEFLLDAASRLTTQSALEWRIKLLSALQEFHVSDLRRQRDERAAEAKRAAREAQSKAESVDATVNELVVKERHDLIEAAMSLRHAKDDADESAGGKSALAVLPQTERDLLGILMPTGIDIQRCKWANIEALNSTSRLGIYRALLDLAACKTLPEGVVGPDAKYDSLDKCGGRQIYERRQGNARIYFWPRKDSESDRAWEVLLINVEKKTVGESKKDPEYKALLRRL